MTRRSWLRLALVLGAIRANSALALMAGNPPDSPIKRLDPNTADSLWSGVGSITGTGGVYTAVLVAPRFVLTAGHVAPVDVSNLYFNLNIGSDLSHSIPAQRAIHHPLYRGFDPQSPQYDLALLELGVAAPSEARIHPFLATLPSVGTQIEMVGYGASGPGAIGATVPANAALKRVGLNQIDEVYGRDPNGGAPLIFRFTFDPPSSPPRLRTASTGNERETGLASGDSGSPVYERVDGRPHLLGINTFSAKRPGALGAPSTFGSLGGGQLLFEHVAWIRHTIGSTVAKRPTGAGAGTASRP